MNEYGHIAIHCYTQAYLINKPFIFLVDIGITAIHLAHGFPEQGIDPSDNTHVDRKVTGITNIVPFLGETVSFWCDYELEHSTPEYILEFQRLFQPFICVSIDKQAPCTYKEQVYETFANFTFDEFDTDLLLLCETEERPCGEGVSKTFELFIRGELLITLISLYVFFLSIDMI